MEEMFTTFSTDQVHIVQGGPDGEQEDSVSDTQGVSER